MDNQLFWAKSTVQTAIYTPVQCATYFDQEHYRSLNE